MSAQSHTHRKTLRECAIHGSPKDANRTTAENCQRLRDSRQGSYLTCGRRSIEAA